MSEMKTISELASAAEIPTSTLRYYERVGLVNAESRSDGNYRLYSERSLQRVRFIRAAQGIGFTLEDVKILLGSQDDETPECGEVQSLIEARLGDVERQLKELRQVRRVLQRALQKCQETEKEGCCYVIETLQEKL